jgi:hypothetical protein
LIAVTVPFPKYNNKPVLTDSQITSTRNTSSLFSRSCKLLALETVFAPMLETFHEEPGTLRRLLSWRACRVRGRPDPLAHQRCALLRCSWDQTMQKLLAAALVVSWFWGGEARAQTGPLYCYGQYALCPASTCMPTGYEITTRVVSTSGVFIGYRRYPEAVCTCPVLQGKFQASGANLGQMEGSCAQPGWGLVWSLYSPMPLPQAFNYSLKEEH